MCSMRQSRYLLVTNLPDCITEDKISDHFKRYGPVQSVTPQQPGCATVAFIDIRSAAKAFGSADNLIDEHVIKTQYCEPPASSTASAIYIHDTRDDVLSRPANNNNSSSSHNSSGSSTSSASTSAFPQSSSRSVSGRHSLLTPATRSLSEDRLYEREQQRTGSCNNYERSSYKQRLHHEEDLRSRIPRDRQYRSDRFSESGSDRKRRHLEVINKPVNSMDRTPEVRVEKTAAKLVADAENESVTGEEVTVCRPGHQTTIITRIVNYGDHVVDAVVVQEPSPASDHFSRRSLSSCKSGSARVAACIPTPGKDAPPVRIVDAATPVNLSLSDPRRSSLSSSSLNSSRLTADSAVDAESGIVTSTDSLPHDVYSSSHKNEDHGCEVSSSSDKPLVKPLTPNQWMESLHCMSLPLPEFAAEKMLLELSSSKSSHQQSPVVTPFTSIGSHHPSPKNNNAITSPINIFSPCPLPPKRLRNECSTDSKGSEVTTSDRESTENPCLSKHADLSGESVSKKSPRSPKSIADRIRAIDERMNHLSHSSTTAMPAAIAAAAPVKCDLPPNPTLDYSKYNIKKKSQVSQSAAGDSQRSEPSDIMKNLLSKSSIFDQDSKRLEHINEKYEPSKDSDPLSANRPMFRTKAAAKEFAPSHPEPDARRSSTSSSSSSSPVKGLACLSRKMSEPAKLPAAVKKETSPTTPLSAPARSFSNSFTPFSNSNPVIEKQKQQQKEAVKCPAATETRRESDPVRDPRTQKSDDVTSKINEKKPVIQKIQKSHSMPSGSKNPSTQQLGKSSDSRASLGSESKQHRWSSSDFMDTDSEPVKGDSKQISKQISTKSKITSSSSSSSKDSHSKSESGKKDKSDSAVLKREGQLKSQEKSVRKSDAHKSSPFKSKRSDSQDRSHPKSENSLKDKLLKKEQERKSLSGKNRSETSGKKKEKLSAKQKELRKLGITEEPVYLSMYDKVKARSSANQSQPSQKAAEPAAQSKSPKQSRKRDDDLSSDSDSDSSSGSVSEVERKRKRKRVIQSSSSSSSSSDDSGAAASPSKGCSVKSSPRSSAALTNKSKSKSLIRAAVDSDSDSDERSSAKKTKVRRKGISGKKQPAVLSSSSSSSSSSDEADEEDEKDEDDDDDDERVPPRKKQQRKGLHKGSERVSVSSDDQSPHEKRFPDHLHNKKTKKAEKKTEKEMMAKRSKTQDKTLSEKTAASGAPAAAEKQRESETTSKIKATDCIREKSHAAHEPPPPASKSAFSESPNKLARKKNKSFLREKERLKDLSFQHKNHSPDSDKDRSLHHSSDSGSASPKKKKFKKEDLSGCGSSRDKTKSAARTGDTLSSKHQHCDTDNKRSSDSSDHSSDMHAGNSLIPSDLSDDEHVLCKTKTPAVISHTEWERSECGKVSSKAMAGLSSSHNNNKKSRKMSGSTDKHTIHDRAEKTSFEKIISNNDAALFEKKPASETMAEIRRVRMSSGSSDPDSNKKQKPKTKKLIRETEFDRVKDVLSFSCMNESKASPPLVSSTSDNMVSVLLKSPTRSASPPMPDNVSESSEDMKLDRDLSEAAQRTAEKAEQLESESSSDDLLISTAAVDDVSCLSKNREDREQPQRSFEQEAAIETKRLEVELNQSWKSEPAHHFEGLICSTTSEPIPQIVDEEPVATPDPELVVVAETELELHDPCPLIIESSLEKDSDGKDADHRRMEDDLAVSALLQEMDDSQPEQETGIEHEIPYLSILTDEDQQQQQQQAQPSLHISEDLHPEPEQLKQAISSVLPHESKDITAAHAPAVEAVADPIPKSVDEIQEPNSASAKERRATPEPPADILTAFNRSPIKRLSTETLPLAPNTTVTPAVVSVPTIADQPKRSSRDAESAVSSDPSEAVVAKDPDSGPKDDETVSELDDRKSRCRKAKFRKSVTDPCPTIRSAEKTEPLPSLETGTTNRRRAVVEKIRRSPRVASLDPELLHAPSDTHDEFSGDESNAHSRLPHGDVSDHAEDSDHNEQKKRRGRRKKVSGDVKTIPEVVAVPSEPKVPVRERLHVLLPSTDKPSTDAPKSLSPSNVFDFNDDDDDNKSPLPLFFAKKTLKIIDTKHITAPALPAEEKKTPEPISLPTAAVPVAPTVSPVATVAPVSAVPSSASIAVPVCSTPSASSATIAASISCEELSQKVAASVPEAQDKREADKEKDAKYITELSGHGKLSMTIRIQKEGQADGGTAEIVKTSVKVPEELPKPAKPSESEADVVKATRKSARLMSQNKSTIDEVIEDVIKGKSMSESEMRLRRMQRSGRKSVDSAAAPDVSEDGDLSEETESQDKNLRPYRLTRSSTRGSTGGEEADTADECSNPAPATRRQSVKAAEVSEKVISEQKSPDESVSETPVIEPAVVSHPAASAPVSNMPAVTRKDAAAAAAEDHLSSQTCEVRHKSLAEDAVPIEEKEETPSDNLTKAELPAPVSHTPPTTTTTATTLSSSVIQEPHRTPLVPSVSERIHNSTTAQKLKTGKGLEYLIEETVVPDAVRADDKAKHAVPVQPPPAHTKITIEAKQPSIQTSIVPPEKRSPVGTVLQVGHATRVQEQLMPNYDYATRDGDQNLPPHVTPQQQKDYLAAVQQQEMAHRLQQEQRLAPPATPPPPVAQVPAAPHHLRPMVMPVPPLPMHSEQMGQMPYNMLMFPHPFGLHPSFLTRPSGFSLPIAVDQKDALRATIEKEEQKNRIRTKDDPRIEQQQQQQHQQRVDFAADEEALQRLHMSSNMQMRGMPYPSSRLPHHLLSPHERISDSPVIPHSFIPRHHIPSGGDHKVSEFQHSPVLKSDGDRKPGLPYPVPPAVTPGMDRSFGIASPAPAYLDGRSVHPAAHSPGSRAFRSQVPSPICRDDELRKFHHAPYGKEMSSPVAMNHPAGTYHMSQMPHHGSGEHGAEGLLTRGHAPVPPDSVSRQSPHVVHRPPTPPHASSHPPASGDSILLQRYPIVWQGLLALKNDQAAVQMHFLSGSKNIAHSSLPPLLADGPSPVRISQRMRLEQAQLEGVARKMQMPDEHCILLALPCGRDSADVLQQSTNLKNGFIHYLQSKQAAGIVNSSGSGPQATSFVIHIFPSSDFSTECMSRKAPDLLHGIADIAHLMIIIATV